MHTCQRSWCAQVGTPATWMRLANGEAEMRNKVSVKLRVTVARAAVGGNEQGAERWWSRLGETLAEPVAVPQALQLQCAGQVRPCCAHACLECRSLASIFRPLAVLSRYNFAYAWGPRDSGRPACWLVWAGIAAHDQAVRQPAAVCRRSWAT